jgi:hypothetical protein
MMLHYTYKSIEQARFYEDWISNKNSQDEGYLEEGYKKGKTEPWYKETYLILRRTNMNGDFPWLLICRKGDHLLAS